MSPTIQIAGVAVAVFVTIGVSIAIQLLDARIARARFESETLVDSIEVDEVSTKAAAPVTISVVQRGAAGSKRKRGHGR